jgi:hypothetical protein
MSIITVNVVILDLGIAYVAAKLIAALAQYQPSVESTP